MGIVNTWEAVLASCPLLPDCPPVLTPAVPLSQPHPTLQVLTPPRPT